MGPVGTTDHHHHQPQHQGHQHTDNQSEHNGSPDRNRFHDQEVDQRPKQSSFTQHHQQQSQARSMQHPKREQVQQDHNMDAFDSVGNENHHAELDEDSEENVDELMDDDDEFEEEGGYDPRRVESYHRTSNSSSFRQGGYTTSSSSSTGPNSNGSQSDRRQFDARNETSIGSENGDGEAKPQQGRWEYRPMEPHPYARRPQSDDIMDNPADGPGSDEDQYNNGGSQEESGPASNGVNNGSSKKRTTPARHKCPQCDKYFTRPFNLKSHQRTHTQERPFVCSFAHCARAFSRLHDCNRHMRTHWRIKPYSCPECHRNFVRQDALTRHLRLDFGHNRCSGYPGPSSGSSAAHGQDGRTASPEDGSSPSNDGMTDPSGTVPRKESGHGDAQPTSAFTRSPSPTSPMVVSPTTQKPKESKSRQNSSISVPRGPPTLAPAPMGHTRIAPREVREASGPYPPRDVDAHARNPAPLSFVHRGPHMERRAVTPPDAIRDETNYHAQHGRSFSHSSFSQGQLPNTGPHSPTSTFPPPKSAPLAGPISNGSGGSEKRPNAPPVPRHSASWSHQGHESSDMPTKISHGSTHSRQAQEGPLSAGRYPEGPHAPDQHHRASRPKLTHSQSEYPAPALDMRRHSPTSPRTEYPPRPENAGQWGAEQRPPDARMRHPSWSSPSSARGPPPPLPGSYPPDHAGPLLHMPPTRAMTMDSWHRGAHYPPHDSRGEQPSPHEMLPRPPTNYSGGSIYSHDSGRDHQFPGTIPHSEPMPRANAKNARRQESEREPLRRSTTEYDRASLPRPPLSPWGPGDHRSRSFHQDAMVDPRARHESYGGPPPLPVPTLHGPPHGREKGFAPRPFDGPTTPAGGPAAPASAPASAVDRGHPYGAGGMVGTERGQSRSNSFLEREPVREGMPTKEGAGDPREYNKHPQRSFGHQDYEMEKRAHDRQSRYADAPKVMTRELRRSMSPQSAPTTSEISPRYQYSSTSSASVPHGGGDRRGPPEPFGREDMERFRSVRPHDRVQSPLTREDQSGYFGESVVSASSSSAGSRSGPSTPYGSAPYPYSGSGTSTTGSNNNNGGGSLSHRGNGPELYHRQLDSRHEPGMMRGSRDRGSIDIAMSPLTISTPTSAGPPSAKRSIPPVGSR
ncbi:hypothetical protein BGZ83_005915 [Gryganskiella cystojenkinii]|nr:hypothetical protein BGZ83_005915 [Gryganskiella cystojenkinii]